VVEDVVAVLTDSADPKQCVRRMGNAIRNSKQWVYATRAEE
jgi:hypothetical protein